ncbi:MAG: GMC family oxidoreductase N-terminal domain-containing protein, partial [Bacteroidota bacterium]|nr:GMC family oxidoreductase N-terminal domain-containing protein [Candidatus Kapabacteria bacterium]MDW8219047.1 GMC family oxidoreductase N-terminal domain-containing protein [Bacteroidota bacterium]
MNLSSRHTAVLRAVCDALIPSVQEDSDIHGLYAMKASDFALEEKITRSVEYLSEEQQRDFLRLLNILASRLLGLTWFGGLRAMQQLTPNEAETMLRRWSQSTIPQLRQGFHVLKKLAMFLFYGFSDENTVNPTWKAIGYPGPLSAPPQNVPRPIQPLSIDQDTVLSCDVVVVGSGAGGGVVAGELADAGFDIIVIEKGRYGAEQDFTQREAEMVSTYYEAGGTCTTKDGSISLFAGSCLGGGTTINWTAALRTPEYVLEEWAQKHGNPHFASPEYKRSFQLVESATCVNTA